MKKPRATKLRRSGRRTAARLWAVEALERRELLNATPDAPLLVQWRSATPSPAELAEVSMTAPAAWAATSIPGLYQVQADAATLARLQTNLSGRADVRYAEPEQTVTAALTPNDPSFTNGSLWGLNGAHGINAPAAWDVTTGSTGVTVADIDTGMDYNHADLYENVWINQLEIPKSRMKNLTDVDGDGLITFYDLNNPVNQGPGKITDINGDGRIDAADILAPMQKDASGNDTGLGGWADPTNVQDGDTAHPDDLIGWNFVNNTNNPTDDNGHGTSTAGIIGEMGNNGLGGVGVNWKTQIMPLKFLDNTGNGTDLGAAEAIRYAADHGARVSNNSYGDPQFSQPITDAIGYAQSKGQVFAAAAGNTATNNDMAPFYPANDPHGNVVSVAAIDSTGALATFSDYGATTVTLGAPGVLIGTTAVNSNYDPNFTGTSAASPFVAGVAALVLAAHPGWSYSQVINAIKSTVTPDPSLAGKTVTGGALNAAGAVGASPSPSTLQVTLFTPNPSGFSVRFDTPIDPSVLHLYTSGTNPNTAGPVSVTLTGSSTGAVRGSLALDPDNMGFTFVKTGGPLPTDTYTVDLRSSATNGIRTASGHAALDGHGDGTPGDDYTTTFSNTAAAVSVGVPDFMRGPGQSVVVPASGGTGLPVQVSNAAGVKNASFTVRFNPNMLSISAAAADPDMPAMTQVNATLTSPGVLVITVSSPTPLAAGALNLVDLTATVPNNAPYANKEAISVDTVSLKDGSNNTIAASGDVAVHVVGYLGDASGDGFINAFDNSLIQRVILGLDTGFGALKDADPTVVADINGDGFINAFDNSLIQRFILGQNPPQIPAITPGVTPILGAGADPLVSLPKNLSVAPGGAVSVPVDFLQTAGAPIDLGSFDLAIAYDPSAFSVVGVRPGSLAAGSTFLWSVDPKAGLIYVSEASRSGPAALAPGTSGTLALLDLKALPGARPGSRPVNLLGSVYANGEDRATRLNDGHLVLSPAPTNGAGDPVDGLITVTGGKKGGRS
jgi:subtilisin family serine protease